MRSDPRSEAVARTPPWYSPWGHLAATVGIAGTGIVVAALRLHEVRLWECTCIPLVFVLANFFEWFVHKNVLHHRQPGPFAELFDKHTPEHHAMYHETDMALRDVREFRLVLIPAVGVLGAILSAVPLGYLAGRLLSVNCGWFVMFTAAAYMASYELSHLAYHLPSSLWISSVGIVKVLRKHHAIHHRPETMQKYNFNVTIPLADWALGTIAPIGPRETSTAAEGQRET
jgi:Fatty acid hydroxylase superfamily